MARCKISFACRHMKTDQFYFYERRNVITNVGFNNQCWICILPDEDLLEPYHKFVIFNLSG